MPRNYQPCSQFVKTSLVYRTLQSYKVCRVNTMWNVAGTVGGDAESLRDQRWEDDEQTSRTDPETSAADIADIKQSVMDDLSQGLAAISGAEEPQFGSQHATTTRWMAALLCVGTELLRQPQRASKSHQCTIQHGKERENKVQGCTVLLFRVYFSRQLQCCFRNKQKGGAFLLENTLRWDKS